MRNLLIMSQVLWLFACKKIDNIVPTPSPAETEQALTFSTDLGNSATIDVKDTLKFKVNVTSKMPTEVIYSVEIEQNDIGKVIYKKDSSSKSASHSYSLPVFQAFASYSLKLTVSSKTNSNNNASVKLNLINDVGKNFQGYKVDPNARKLGASYWRNVALQHDLVVNVFQNPYQGQIGGALLQITCGDFNNDGWVDVFNPGWSFNGPRYGVGFLIWNPVTKVFEDKNLFTNKIISFGGNQDKTIPVYLNDDNYVDLVIFDSGDEGIPNSPPQPIRLAISNGKGEYD